MVKSILKVLKKNQIHLKKAVVCVVAMALILQSLVYYGQNYTLDAKATEVIGKGDSIFATTSGDAKAISLNSSGTDSLKEDGLEADSEQGDSSGTDSAQEDGLEADSEQGDSSGTDSTKEDGLVADSAQGDSSGTDSSTGTAEGSVTENSTGTGNDSVENQDATTSGDAKADDSETDATPEDDSDGKLDNLMAEITNSLLEMAASYNSNYIYLNPAGMNLGEEDWDKVLNVYIYGFDWKAFTIPASRDEKTGYWYWDLTGWNDLETKFSFTIYNNWEPIKEKDYRRTSVTDFTLAEAKGKIFVLKGVNTNTDIHNGKKVYDIKEFTSLAGNTINFIDMTQSSSLTKVTAVFGGTGLPDKLVSMIKNQDGYYSVTIPADETVNGSDVAYSTVYFQDSSGKQLGATYNFFNSPSVGSAEVGFAYEADSKDTFYYGVTEQPNKAKIHTWGSLPAKKQLNGKILYFANDILPASWTFKVNGTPVELSSVANAANYKSYKFSNAPTAAQNTVLTLVSSDGTKYHFMWNDILNNNLVEIDDGSSIANVTGQYVPGDRTIYFDATFSKLSYKTANADDNDLNNDLAEDKSGAIPYEISSGKPNHVFYYAIDSDRALGETNPIFGEMVPVEDENDVFQTEYYVGAEYDKICFSNYDMKDDPNYSGGWAGGTKTILSEIPAALSRPCFYADTGDQSVYYPSNDNEGRNARGGYWQELYQINEQGEEERIIRDPNEEKAQRENTASADVVDIKKSTFTRDAQTLYVNSTFYDYYTDYELNGYNRDTYKVDITEGFSSQRNWVTFRQFNQALSDYYKGNSATIPIYTGHFQTDNGGDFPFTDVAKALDLFEFGRKELASKPSLEYNGAYNKFFSTNNSEIDVDGYGYYPKKVIGDTTPTEPLYDYAAQALVCDKLQKDGKTDVDSSLMMATDEGSTIKEPHFDEDFLTGNNSKNAVLGEVYHNVSFPFTQVDRDNNGIKYWTFDSANDTVAMRQDTNTGAYYLHKYGDGEDHDWSRNVNAGSNQYDVSNTFGFFPFNETSTASADDDETSTTGDRIEANTYNYGYGAKLEFNFKLTSNGRVKNDKGEEFPITFEFSGDDDVWVFIDGDLVLDIGGAHGVVHGKIDFSDDPTDDVWQMKATVNRVKSSAGSEVTNGEFRDVESLHQLDINSAKEHTLTMFYMERGMWESNMSISFNFPDENQLEVEKQVDTTDVNKLFKPLFDNISLFEFDIKNLATHYEAYQKSSTGEATTEVFNADFKDSVSVLPNSDVGFKYLESEDEHGGIAYWRAYAENHNAAQRDNYCGVISASTKNGYVDISNMRYLEFEYYYAHTDDTPSLSYMYLQLVDTDGKIKGNVTDYLSRKTYGMVNMVGGSWVTVKVDLTALKAEPDFNNKVKYIRFGYDYPRDIYLDNFIFYPTATVNEHTGFITKQYEIPDYGSATSGNLEIPKGAVYSSTTGASQMIAGDGKFYLKNGETVTFKDQFRRGSYIYLAEKASSLFETSWTMYENGQEVTSYGAIDGGDATDVVTYNDDFNDDFNDTTEQRLVNVKEVTVNDGRIEPYIEKPGDDGKQTNNTGYTEAKRPDDTFVFRSYAYPNNDAMLIKLKVVYTNKVNVGSLNIVKEQKRDEDNLKGKTYQFKVTFYNIGGVALEDEVIEQTVSVTAGAEAEEPTITGIPIGTFYTVEEIKPTDGSSLDSVTLSHGPGNVEKPNMILETGTNIVKGVIEEQTSENDIPTITFTNTTVPKISVSMTKEWKVETGNALDGSKQPASITVQLQRKKPSETTFTVVDNFDVNPKKEGSSIVWSCTVDGLDKYADVDEKIAWEYRFVELDSEGKVIENGKVFTLTDNSGGTGDYEVSYSDITKDSEGNHSQTITNTLLGPAKLEIIKLGKDANGSKLLKDVTFKLEQKNADGDYVDITDSHTSDNTTDSDGKVSFANLENGTYRLTETKTAEGYTLLKEPIIITIDRKSNKYTWKMESEENAQELDADSCWNSETRTLSITITNSKNIQLPSTGGYSPIPIMAGGMALSMAASLLYINKKKRRRKEGKPPGT